MPLHGRDGDLALLAETLVSARAGRGRALFFTGEAGIGKSTLIAEARARAGDAVVLAGAAWESGGAPPYWPWQQVLRDAAEQFGARVCTLPGADRIAALVPEWSSRVTVAVDAPDPAAARFALLDAVSRALVALAADRPLVILLDDLHAADLPTLDLLVQITREVPRAAIALVGAWREGELAVRGDAAQRLARASRQARVQPLQRLTEAELASWVGGDAATLHASTEGNPLFVEEMLRAKRGGLGARGIASVLEDHLALVTAETRDVLATASVLGREIDPTLLRALADRDDDAIATALRDALATGIVERRDTTGSPLRGATARDTTGSALREGIARDARDTTGSPMRDGTARDARDTTGSPLREGTARDARDTTGSPLRPTDATAALERRPTWAFRHILLRDHLYDALPPSRRAALHRRAGELLERNDPTRAAHHLLTGIVASDEIARAVTAARIAAAHASKIYAFEDAADVLALALRALETFHGSGTADAIDLRLDLATALHSAGRNDTARSECIRAAELARPLGDAEQLARAAMVYASELMTGRRDATMISLLEEARAMLPTSDSPTLARVTTRLAAALVPDFVDPERPEVLAREGVAMARRLDDDSTTMFVLRYSAHAHGFRMGVVEARDVAQEVVTISDRLGRPLEALEHRTWLVGACVAMGRLAEAEAALDNLDHLLARVPQPHYRWRVPLLRAIRAATRGQFSDADRWVAIVRELAREYDLDRARFASMFADVSIVATSRSRRRAERILEPARAFARMFGPMGDALVAFISAIAGRHDEARALLNKNRELFAYAIVIMQFAAETVVMLEERELALLAYDALADAAALHPIANGPGGGLIMRPAAVVIGELLLLLDRTDEGIEQIERGLALARAIESPPFIANATAALARALELRGAPADRERARALVEESARIQRVLDVDDLTESVSPESSREPEVAPALPTSASGSSNFTVPTSPTVSSNAAVPTSASGSSSVMVSVGVMASSKVTESAPANVGVSASTDVTITCDREHACVRWRGRELIAPATKGIEYLAMLVSSPGSEVHVSDLVGDDDRGDAGDVLDAKARTAYRDRAEDLRGELDEARTRNDLGRIERLTEELDSITDQLLASTGLGGRARKAGSRVQRARVNVQRRIKDAIRRLAGEDEALGRYLEATVRTGTFCSFVPIEG